MTVADSYDGKKLNSPNDIVCHSSGRIYFTDPPYGIDPDPGEQGCNGVYCADTDGTVKRLFDDFGRPNGIALSPDESLLYTNDTVNRNIRVCDVNADGSVSNDRVFVDMNVEAEGNPDGMKVDVDGNIYCTGGGGVWVIDAQGNHLGTIPVPHQPTNLAFREYRHDDAVYHGAAGDMRDTVEGAGGESVLGGGGVVMPVYRVTERDFEPLSETSFEKEGLYERFDLQRRLRDRPDILEKGLYILAEEYGDWEESNRRIDLLAVDEQRRLVVIELKRSDWDSLMDLQAIRYAAMVADMTLEQAINAHQGYLRNRSRDEEEGVASLRARLTDDSEGEGVDSSKPRIILVSASFSKELTTSVLWLNRTGMDITCVKLQPWRTGDDLFLESSQVIPIPEASEYQVRLRNREEEAQQQQSEASTVETFEGSGQFRQAIQAAREGWKPFLSELLKLAESLEEQGLAKLVTRVGSYNTVLRVHLPDRERGFFYVYKNRPGYGYLSFSSPLQLEKLAPRSKERLEQTVGSLSTLWELPEGFIEVMTDAYREASGQPAALATTESSGGSESTNSD